MKTNAFIIHYTIIFLSKAKTFHSEREAEEKRRRRRSHAQLGDGNETFRSFMYLADEQLVGHDRLYQVVLFVLANETIERVLDGRGNLPRAQTRIMFTDERRRSQLRRQRVRSAYAQTFQRAQPLTARDQFEVVIRREPIVVEIEHDETRLLHQHDEQRAHESIQTIGAEVQVNELMVCTHLTQTDQIALAQRAEVEIQHVQRVIDGLQDAFETIGDRRAAERQILQVLQLREDFAELFEIVLIETKVDEVAR